MVKFLIDANLPSNCTSWKEDNFIHVNEKSSALTDTEIWDWAKKHNLIIVSKDSDFSQRILHANPPPKVVHIRVGNMQLRIFNEFIVKIWPEVADLINVHKLVYVYHDRLEGIG